jgi:hypothetical protein
MREVVVIAVSNSSTTSEFIAAVEVTVPRLQVEGHMIMIMIL